MVNSLLKLRQNKGFTDRFMAWRHGQVPSQLRSPVLNLRIRMPIVGEDHPHNFVTKITRYEKVCSIHNSMSVLPELLPMALELMKNKYTGTLVSKRETDRGCSGRLDENV